MSSGSDVRLRPSDSGAVEDESEGDKGKFADPKKLHKQNKELVKHNTQLMKLVDTLKHEKDSLAIDKNRLKTELKSTEKELKKVKSEVERHRAKNQKQGSSNMGEEMQERVRQLEAELSQRDEKLARLQKRISNRLNRSEGEGEDSEEEVVAVTGKEKLNDDAGTELKPPPTAKLEEENAELRLKIINLESDLNQLLRVMDDQQREEFVSSKDRNSRDTSLRSTFSADALSEIRHGGQNSPLPRNSPMVHRKNQTSEDVTTLQSCLKLALEEKKMAEQQTKSLQAELERVRSELEKSKSAWQQEIATLQQQLLNAHEEEEAKRHHNEVRVEVEVAEEIKQQSGTSSPTKTRRGSTSGSTDQHKSTSARNLAAQKSDTALVEPGKDDAHSEDKEEKPKRRRGSLQKQQSRESFTAALALFQGSETVTQRERSTSDTSPGSRSSRSSASPAPIPTSPCKLSTDNRSQSATVVGKPPIHPSSSSSSSNQHSRQSSMDESTQKSPSKMSIGAKRMGWAIAQRRQSFEEQSTETSPKHTTRIQHNRTASSPIMTRTLGSPVLEKPSELKEKMNALEKEQKVNEEKAKREQERQKQELEAQEKKKRELEAKKRQEAEEKERLERERQEREQARKEREQEREREHKRKEEERKKHEEERERARKEREQERERERKRQEEEKKKREEEREMKRKEEREKARKEREEERERERKRQEDEKKKREEEREKNKREELEKKQLHEEKIKQEQKLQKAKEMERERRRKEEREEEFKWQNEAEERKRQQEEKLQSEEEKRAAEKAAQAATDPQPHKINKYQSPFGSIATRRAAFEQNTNPSNSPTVVLRHNPARSPAQRPKSMDIAALMSTSGNSSPSVSPTPRSPQISSITVKTSKSPQLSPVLNQRKAIKEVPVTKTTISKPEPPIIANNRPSSVYITTTSSTPPLRRSQTLSSGPVSMAVSTPDLTSAGTTSGTSSPVQDVGWSPSSQRRTTPKSPLSERKVTKSVSFSPNLSTAGRSILKPSPPTVTAAPSPNRMKFGPVHTQLSVPGDDMKKAQSLQNIPEHAPAQITQHAMPRHVPAASHVQRRPRSERAKTTSLSGSDTVNLTNLISKLQEKEKTPVANGVDRTQRTGFTQSGRPASMYGSITPTRYRHVHASFYLLYGY